jgi:hypothetical protein
MKSQEERRQEADDLPTRLEISFERMDADDKDRLQAHGFKLIFAGVLVSLGGGLWAAASDFVIPLYLWLAKMVIFIVGVMFVWPRAAIYLVTSLPGFLRGLIPSAKLRDLLKPVERRGPRDEGD